MDPYYDMEIEIDNEIDNENTFPFLKAIPYINNELCDISSLNHAFTLKKESASNGVMIKGNIANGSVNQDVFIKISPCNKVTSNIVDSLEYERIVYEKVPNELLIKHYTPNMIGNIGRFYCGLNEFVDNNLDANQLNDFMTIINNTKNNDGGNFPYNIQEQYKNDKKKLLELIFTHTVTNFYYKYNNSLPNFVCGTINEFLYKYSSLNDYIKSLTETSIHWKSILFQIFYNLHLLEQLKINHYDLHTNNIAIETDTSQLPVFHNQQIYYKIDNNNIYKVPLINNMVKFFDWDNSFVESLGLKNVVLDNYNYCNINGMCNYFSPSFDTIRIILDMYSILSYKFNDEYNKYMQNKTNITYDNAKKMDNLVSEFLNITGIIETDLNDMIENTNVNLKFDFGKPTNSLFMQTYRNQINELHPLKMIERLNNIHNFKVANVGLDPNAVYNLTGV